jgi:hypothetical protein
VPTQSAPTATRATIRAQLRRCPPPVSLRRTARTPCIFLTGGYTCGEEWRGVTDRVRLGRLKPVTESWSSRPYSEHPEQLPGPRARISQGREAER